MAKKAVTPQGWNDMSLSGRAMNAVRNMTPKHSPDDLREALKKDYQKTLEMLMRIPNCGRHTIDEIFEELEFVPPEGRRPKLVGFVSDDEVLLYLAREKELDVNKLDRNTIQLMLSLVARDLVTVDKDFKATLGEEGEERVTELRDEERVELVLQGTRKQIRRFIERLDDNDPYLDEIESALQEIDSANKAVVVLTS